ncbi:MAG: hypothetical protein KKE23_01825 [Nanoarchaeota archaeon]|nr:hypothetical protein [Nanoarchaeota archaeon]
MTNMLFVCRNNQLRSKVAEDFFKQFNKNPEHSARSAGILSGNLINQDLARWANRIIIVADNVSPSMIEEKYGKKVEIWGVSSNDNNLYREIENKVKTLLGEIGNA